MRIAIVHDAVGEGASADTRDVVVQAEAVAEALSHLGHESVSFEAGLDLADLRREIERITPDLVFNLVESMGGQGRLIHLVPLLLDGMGIAYTGAPADAIYQTSNKLAAKRMMRLAGIVTPEWVEVRRGGGYDGARVGAAEFRVDKRWIIKSVWEHASIGLGDDSVVIGVDERKLRELIRKRDSQLGGDAFAEAYIEGREFNLALLAHNEGVEVLPVAEIEFRGFDPGRARIVGYRAKWDEGSFEFENTPRRFAFASEDQPLLERLREIAIQCWRVFGVRGYARVDFRVDADGQPWVLEVNANPCLSPDAGFAAALREAGIPFMRAIDRIVRDGASHRGA